MKHSNRMEPDTGKAVSSAEGRPSSRPFRCVCPIRRKRRTCFGQFSPHARHPPALRRRLLLLTQASLVLEQRQPALVQLQLPATQIRLGLQSFQFQLNIEPQVGKP